MRFPVAIAMSLLVFGGFVALAGDIPGAGKKGPPARVAKPPDSPAAREAAALAFVTANHPELAALLAQLKPMRPGEYDRAIRELFQVKTSLEKLKAQDPRRYDVGLRVWKARSRVELLTAKLVSAPDPGSESEELKSRLRTALTDQLAIQIEQQKLERDLAAERVEKLKKNIERLESNRDKVIENRFQGLLNKSRNARRKNGGKTAPPAPAKDQGESKA